MALAQAIAEQYARLPQVVAVALGGSRSTQAFDAGSDIDLYVYAHDEVPLEARRAVAEPSARQVEVNNRFWELGDEWIDASSGIHVDVMFRSIPWIEAQLERVLKRHEASVGYSTCFWHNIRSSRALFDKDGWFSALQTKAQQPYPEELRRAVIAKNHPILRDTLSSYLYQIKSAVKRGDRVSLNHRVAALLASYFDILFAVNRLLHPGEKRLLQIAQTHLRDVPEGMHDQVRLLLDAASGRGDVEERVHDLLDALDVLLERQGLLPP